jgi:hypothetical protein
MLISIYAVRVADGPVLRIEWHWSCTSGDIRIPSNQGFATLEECKQHAITTAARGNASVQIVFTQPGRRLRPRGGARENGK